jgi:hypothetical protein
MRWKSFSAWKRTTPAGAAVNSRRFVAIYAGIAAITLALLARASWATLLYELLTDGLFTLLWLVAGYGYGSLFLRRFRIETNRAFRVISEIALGLGFIALVTLALGLLGFLTAATSWGMVLIGALAAALPLREWFAKKTATAFRPHWLYLLTAPPLAIATFAALILPGILWGDEPNGYDVVEYHLQIPREWFESARITPLTHNVFSYFPQGMEMHYLLAMHLRGGPWSGMYLAQLMHVAMGALLVLAASAVAIELGASAAKAASAALILATAPWILELAPIAYNECGLLLYLLLAAGWAIRAMRVNTPANVQYVTASLAGVFAGLACGMKLTAAPLAFFAITPIFHLGGQRRMIDRSLIFLASMFIAFSPWLIRTWSWTGNPVFPEAQRMLGKAHFSDTQVERWHRAHSPRRDQTSFAAPIDALWTQVIDAGDYGYVLLIATAVAFFFAPRRIVDLGMMILATLIFWLFFTHLQGRFFTPALPFAAILVATANWRRAAPFIFTAVIFGNLVGFLPRLPKLVALAPIIGIEDLSQLAETNLAEFPKERRLVLIGEAKAFFYPLPMSRLSYRTVFDVDVDDKNLIDAWAAGAIGERLIDPNELRRFSRTYYGIPDPNDPHSEPYLIPAP